MSNTDSPLKGLSPDQAIASNLVFCLLLGIPLFITFCALRLAFKEVYSPNVLNTNRKTCGHVPDGKLAWIGTVMRMSDEELLPWIGLDGFIFIQTIRLIIGLLVILAVPALLFLVPIYYIGAGTSVGQWSLRISIVHVSNSHLLWFPVVFHYYMVAVVFYGLYMFYRNVSIYRQAYLRSPSSCVAQVSMRRISRNIGSMRSARKIIDLASRTAVITNVSAKYSKSEIISMFDQMGIKDISAVVIVQNRKRVRKILLKRNNTIELLEGDFRTFYTSLLEHVSSERSMTPSQLESIYKDDWRIDTAERKELLKQLLEESKFQELRPRHKEDGFTVDSISNRYKQLIQHDDELIEAANRFATDNERYVLDFETHSPIADDDFDMSEDTDVLVAGKTMASWRQFLELKKNVKDYGLTLWGSSMSIIVVFGSQRSATIVEQTLLSGRPFSMEAEPAPTADDIIWDNLYLPEADRFNRRMMGALLYVLVNILFTSANSAIIPLLNLKYLEQAIPPLANLLEQYPQLRGILQGILAPLFYNLFLLLAPYMLFGLSIYQGRKSKTSVQESLLQKYTWLLFIQTFVLYILSSAFVVVIEKVITGKYGEIIERVQAYMPEYATLFLNVILQRAAISLMLVLLKPAGLFLQLLVRMVWKKNLRKRALFSEPDRIFMGALYPENIIFVFMVTLAFLPLTPIISIAGLIFYSIAYLVFRYHFIFSYEIPHESGGKYWTFMPTPLLVGCITSQIFSTIQFSFAEGTAQAIALAPLMIITFGSIYFIRAVFERRGRYLPLSSEAIDRVVQLAEQMYSKQGQTVKSIAREVGEDTLFNCEESGEGFSPFDTKVAVGERNYEAVPYDFNEQQARLLSSTTTSTNDGFDSLTATENPYCNPIMFKRYPNILLPPCFFHLLRDALGRMSQ